MLTFNSFRIQDWLPEKHRPYGPYNVCEVGRAWATNVWNSDVALGGGKGIQYIWKGAGVETN